MVAKNFDSIPLVQPFFILRECRPRNGFRSLEFTVAPMVGAADGVNEKGLCITLDYAFATDAGSPAPLITMVIAEALAKCASVNEAAAFIVRQPRWGAGMLMLADASGDLASVELTNTRSAIRRPAHRAGAAGPLHDGCRGRSLSAFLAAELGGRLSLLVDALLR